MEGIVTKSLTRILKVKNELPIWFMFYVILNYRFIIDYLSGEGDFVKMISHHQITVVFGSSILLFPILFYQIFSEYPFKSIGISIKRNRERLRYLAEQEIKDELRVETKTENEVKVSVDDKSIEYLENLVWESSRLSTKIYNRSGVYLMIGSMIALAGIGYFSYKGFEIQGDIEYLHLLFVFLPRFGALFFIEFIAFFFLKQYRITMDDFKYYDSIKRQREGNVLKLRLYLENGEIEKDDLKNIISSFDFEINPTKLADNETTESLESRKFTNEEIAVFDKIVDNIAKVKGK